MIDIEKLERLAHEAEGATHAMWREVYKLSKAMRGNERPDDDISALVLHMPIETLVCGRDCISKMTHASRLAPTLEEHEAARAVMQLLARLIAIRKGED